MPDGFDGLLDFVGYATGEPSAPVAPASVAGLFGFIDFVGYPVAQPQPSVAPASNVGFHGLLDFCGYPVGVPVTDAVRGKGKTVGGKPNYAAAVRMMLAVEQEELQAEMTQSLLQKMVARQAAGDWLRKIEHDHQQKCLEWAAYSVLLTEI